MPHVVPPLARAALLQLPMRLVLTALVLLSTACAARGRDGEQPAEREPVVIVVNNDLLPSSAVSVWIVPESSGQVLLGSVGPGQREVMEYRPRTNVFTYRLRARLTGGRDVVSNPFSLQGAARVQWDLQSNLAVVVEDRY